MIQILCIFGLVFVQFLDVLKQFGEAVVGTRICIVSERFVADENLVIRVDISYMVREHILHL